MDNNGKGPKYYISLLSKNYIETYYDSYNWREFACGCGSAFFNIGITYPIYKMIFRQMLHGVNIRSAYQQLKFEGIGYLYRGMMPPLAQKTIALSLMFGVYNGTKNYVLQSFNTELYTAQIVAGLVSGTAECILLPFERVQSLLSNAKFNEHFSNTPQAFRYVWSNYGFRELYRGIVPVLYRNGPSNVWFFVLREQVLSGLPETADSSRRLQEFLSGAIIGSTCSSFFYPLNVIKVAMQSDVGHKSQSMLETFLKIYDERKSIRHFYRGCGYNASRSFLSWGIVNVAYEQCKLLLDHFF